MNAFISTDSTGFHWIASSNGVYRFDGKTFINYLPEHDSLHSLVQSNFFEDTLGRIWFSTVNSLNCYDYKTNAVTSKVFAKAPHNYSPAYHILHYNIDRHEFLLSNSQDLWRYRPSSSPTTNRIASTSSARFLPLDRTSKTIILGFPWLLGPGMERIEFRDGRIISQAWSKDSLIKEVRINGGISDHSDRVWLGTESGLVHYDVALDTVLGMYPSPDQTSKEIWSPVVFQDKLAVSTAQSGAWLFNPKTSQYEYPLGSKALVTGDDPSPSPRTLHVTPEGALFAMCRDRGIDVYNPVPNPAQKVIDSDGQALSVSALKTDQLEQVWVATTDGDLRLYGNDGALKHCSKHVFNEKDPILKLQVEQTENEILAHNQHNIFRVLYDRDTGTISIDTLASFKQTIEGFTISPEENPLVRTRNAWYDVSSAGVQQIHHRILDRSSSNDIMKLLDNRFAFSPADQWLYIFSVSNKKVTILDSIATSGTVWSTKELNDNTYLLSTSNGIRYSSQNKLKELVGNEVYDFALRDKQPYIALTSKGLILKEADGQWVQQGNEIGLEGNFNDRSSIAVTRNRVWVGSAQGLYHIRPLGVDASTSSNPIAYITRTWINDRPWPKGLLLNQDSLILDYDENTIEVDVSIVQKVGAAKPDIVYRLTGYQTDWAKLRGGNNIRFTQVPPGSYQLELSLANSKKHKDATTSITVFIHPPYWQTWWFRLLAALSSIGVIASVIGLSYKRRLLKEQQKRERERMIADERDRIGKELHDDLGGELATILFLSQREVRKQPSSNSSRIVELTKASLANMREIIWALESNDTSLDGLIAYTKRYGSTMCSDRNIKFQMINEVPPQVGTKELSPKSRRNLFLITKEAINNSLRHSQSPSIELSYSHSGTTLIIIITDTGQGFDPITIKSGNGMKNLKSRTETLGGTWEIQSSSGIGTSIMVKVPID